jgi:TolA-binding protein
VEQAIQRSQADVKADLQRSDRQSVQSFAELQRSLAQVGARLEDLSRENAQVQGRVDELRRRVDALALQFEVGGPPPPPRGGIGGRPGPPPEAPRAASPTAPGTTPAAPAPPAGSPPPAAVAGTPPGVTSARQVTDLYQAAYLDYTRGNYNLAVAAFKEFIRLYPDTDLAEKAQYWIGESHFSLARDLQARGDRTRAMQEYERAVQEFRRVLINYPRGDRVPTAVYKEPLALIEVGQPALAEARLQFLVDQFPSTEEAAKAKEDLARLRPR